MFSLQAVSIIPYIFFQMRRPSLTVVAIVTTIFLVCLINQSWMTFNGESKQKFAGKYLPDAVRPEFDHCVYIGSYMRGYMLAIVDCSHYIRCSVNVAILCISNLQIYNKVATCFSLTKGQCLKR